MGSMTYMCKNRHGTYYARFIIPKPLQPHFKNKKEIRRSLKTDSRKLAIKRARIYRVEFESIVDQLMSKNDETTERAKLLDSLRSENAAFESIIKGKIDIALPNGEIKPISGEIRRNLASADEDTTHHKEYLLKQLREEARLEEEKSERQAREKRAEELHQAQLAAITIAPALSAPAHAIPTGETVSKCFDDYIAHKLTPGKKGSWSAGTARQKPNKLKVFRSVFGERPISVLTRIDMDDYI